ncbi:MAG TPA: polysaccharide biosynthesis tyrosine autokinase [Longimicrobiaceae bacterium]|nr:polysaccharide biosynthesis tyrosine autokinase [Longimicrobiaceae bacterium]
MPPWAAQPAPSEPKHGPGLQRFITALLRRKWWILGTGLVGAMLGYAGSHFVSPKYQVQSTLWVETSDKGSQQQGPIQQQELLQSAAWVNLLKSFVVLDSVVVEQHLYITTEDANRRAFAHFALENRFRTGKYRLEVAKSGGTFQLSADGTPIQSGRVGEPIGEKLGFDWVPSADVLSPGRSIDFEIVNPRDVSVRLAQELRTVMDASGHFLSLSLTGTSPVQASRTMNSVTKHFVNVAAQLKRAKLDELTGVLEHQVESTGKQLRDSELALQDFRIHTITLPTDQSTPVAPGLESTQSPVMQRFFDMKIEREQIDSDIRSIDRVLAEAKNSGLSLDELLMIPSVSQNAPALKAAIEARISKRGELRELLHRYTPEYPQAQKLSQEIATMEGTTIPHLAGELRAQLLDREQAIDAQINSASNELQQIPPRMIEEARLERQVGLAKQLHADLKGRLQDAQLAAASTIPDVRVLDPAVVPSKPLSDPRPVFILLGLLGGLGLSGVGVTVLDRLDPRVRYPDEVTSGLGLSILGVVPSVLQAPSSDVAREATLYATEAFREIRLNLLHAQGASGPMMLTISSPGSGDGKSFVTSNLALAFADQGHRTLVIDADVRRGALNRVLGGERKPGLTDYLSGQVTQGDVVQGTGFRNVCLIASGSRMQHGPELVGSKQMADLLEDLKSRFDVILVDSPPLGAGADAFALGIQTRNLLLVLRAGATDRSLASMKLAIADRLPIRVVGAVLNGAPTETTPYRAYTYMRGYEAVEEGSGDGQPMMLGGG